jgi:hypothetical protein
MNPRRCDLATRLALAAMLASLLSACAPTLPVIVQPVDCPVSAELLAQRCDEPRSLPDGLSYADLIAIGIADRYALRRCALHDRLLADSLQACQRAIQAYNATLREINAKNAAAKP